MIDKVAGWRGVAQLRSLRLLLLLLDIATNMTRLVKNISAGRARRYMDQGAHQKEEGRNSMHFHFQLMLSCSGNAHIAASTSDISIDFM